MKSDDRSGAIRRGDLGAVLAAAGLGSVFYVPAFRAAYEAAYAAAPLPMAMLKFAVFSTAGEMLAARLRCGRYLPRGFGLGPKVAVWAVLGALIWLAFGVFSAGVPAAVAPHAPPLLSAFLVSCVMNLFFAPMFMVLHHLADLHIARNGGRFPLRSFDLALLLSQADWDRMGNFVFSKTIPFFWIPAHTVTFLLPPAFRVSYTALLSIALGILLSLRKKGA